jgi:Na+-driven multidrug efflux pump
MVAMIIPAIVNIYRYYFIKVMGLDVWRSFSYVHFLFYVLFCSMVFVYKSSRLKVRHFILHPPIQKEITALSFVTFSRQGVVSILAIILIILLYPTRTFHRRLRIISRMLMFALFPILGITQGFIPIAGYNHGAQNYERVKESIQISIKYAALLASLILFLYLLCNAHCIRFTTGSKSYFRDTGCLAVGICRFPLLPSTN